MANLASILRPAVLLAINLLLLMIWGFAGLGKLRDGMPAWFDGKFGKTFLATVPGLPATFWILTISEVLAFALALAALVRIEFLRQRPANVLSAAAVWSLFVFLQLGFGQWLTGEFNGAFQQFMYFCGTLLALQFVQGSAERRQRTDA
jgi:hypothetical protein